MTCRATAFLIWRAGRSVDWDCTYADIAREIGVSRSTVSQICRAKKWKCEGVRTRKTLSDRPQVDTLMNSGARLRAT
jgi:predicted transcriptional regulator